ncbi:MAG: prepilin-type N-terminal cleavage/methylation domain-containing protein [Candidatus Sumerlaeia bacterium]
MHNKKDPKGFTLIELLIVVAIIAILAAIAVPNFLEAQTRAKVSRVYADMRTCATAIEAYCVDHNRYPAYGGRDALITPTAPPEDGGPHFLPYRLTTPIAYMSSLFMEVFQGENTPAGIPKIHELHYFNRYQSPAWWSGGDGKPEPPYNHEKTWREQYGTDASSMQWYLASNGPDLWCDAAGLAIYDPTNGTTSKGDLVWFGPGKGKM